jgi:salicylate hydroxylase
MLQKYGSPFCDIHRADLQLAMFERAKQLGVGFMFDALVTKYDLESPSVTLSNGDQIQGDLIIAADGKILARCSFGPACSCFVANSGSDQ